VAIFSVGHTSLEGSEMPPHDLLVLIQALTMPTKLQEASAALSPHLTPRCALATLSCRHPDAHRACLYSSRHRLR
jgi:hypothetical protein